MFGHGLKSELSVTITTEQKVTIGGDNLLYDVVFVAAACFSCQKEVFRVVCGMLSLNRPVVYKRARLAEQKVTVPNTKSPLTERKVTDSEQKVTFAANKRSPSRNKKSHLKTWNAA